MTPDEVRMLDNRYALLFIRGERPIKDLKYDLLKHPNISRTADGGAAPYIHGQASGAIAEIAAVHSDGTDQGDFDLPKGDYTLLAETDVEKLYMEEDNNEQER